MTLDINSERPCKVRFPPTSAIPATVILNLFQGDEALVEMLRYDLCQR
jgi:hypothetical protein